MTALAMNLNIPLNTLWNYTPEQLPTLCTQISPLISTFLPYKLFSTTLNCKHLLKIFLPPKNSPKIYISTMPKSSEKSSSFQAHLSRIFQRQNLQASILLLTVQMDILYY